MRAGRFWIVWVVLLLAACGAAPGLDRLAVGERGRVAQVLSGHSLVLDSGLEVRLAGIEAPGAGDPHGRRSQAALAGLVEGREVVLLYGGARRDRYGRALAHLRTLKDRRWVQGEMVAAGAARVRTWADNRAMAAPLLAMEAKARSAQAGLWADAAYGVRLTREVGAGARGLLIVEGRPRRAEADAEAVYLMFDDRFEVRIPRRALGDFDAAALAPYSLTGRLVRVRGRASGRRIEMDHPEAVEILRQD